MSLDPVPRYPGDYEPNEANNSPDGTETRKEGDDHIRRMKASEKATWTNVTGAVTATHGQLNLTASLSETEEITQFPTGTKMVFYQNAAPTGWTVDATIDEHTVRLTQGTGPDGDPGAQEGGISGGTYDFSVLFANIGENDASGAGVGGHAISDAESRAHNHGGASHDHNMSIGAAGTANEPIGATNYLNRLGQSSSSLAWATGTATNTVMIQSSGNIITSHGSNALHYHTVDLRAKWAACIVATKD